MATPAILRGRNAPPSDYLFKIKSFSLLSNASIERFSSDDLEAGGYNWTLWIYPTGNKSRNGKDHISIYLEPAETSSLPAGWEVNVILNFFIFNHLRNKYFSIKDGWETRYHAMNTMSGIAKFIDLKTFSNPESGYLLDDTCVFGVEVFVVKNTLKEGCLSMMHEPATCYHTWKVTNFSTLANEKYDSESFGCNKWYIILYPNGNSDGKGNSISLFLGLSLSSIAPGTKLLVKEIMRVKNQMNGKHIEYQVGNMYPPRNSNALGWTRFMSLAKLKDPKLGFLVDDSLIIEVEDLFWIEEIPLLPRKLCIYPTWNKSKNGKNHISIYLELLQTSSLPAGWEVNVISKFVIFNHSQNKYFSNKDWYENRYHAMNTSCGIAKFIDLNTFSNPVNGYLIDNACFFGVEVFVVRNTLKEEHLSMMIEPATYCHTWKVTNFSTLVKKTYVSESFGCYKWNIILYPNGTVEGEGNSISLFLDMSLSSILLNTKLFVKFILRVKQQKMNGKHIEYKEIYLYSSSNSSAFGFREFISLAKLKDPKSGYLVDDTLIIEAEGIDIMGCQALLIDYVYFPGFIALLPHLDY
ncbi:hypothetical protein QYF36_013434 [Acer negundo]|nr:hypothetical protein QYF36_013434 [Acer negundo]